MEELVRVGSLSGARVFSFLLLAVGAGLGFVVFAILHRRQVRRSLGVTAGALLFLGFGAFVYGSTWEDFYAVSFEGDRLVLHYWLPERTRSLSRDQVERLSLAGAGKTTLELRIRTSEGIETSAQSNRNALSELAARIERWRAARRPAVDAGR